MFNLNLRIGTKLAISAAFSVLLLLAAVYNQGRINSITDALDRQARAYDAVQKAILEAGIANRRILMFGREIRLSSTLKELEYPIERLNTYTKQGNEFLERASSLSTEASDKQKIAGALEAFNAQSKIMLEL